MATTLASWPSSTPFRSHQRFHFVSQILVLIEFTSGRRFCPGALDQDAATLSYVVPGFAVTIVKRHRFRRRCDSSSTDGLIVVHGRGL